MLLQLRHCHHMSQTFIYASVTHTKQMKEAANIASVTCLGYNRPCISNMVVLCSSFSILLPAPLSFCRGKKTLTNNKNHQPQKNLFFRKSQVSLNANMSYTNFNLFLLFVLLPGGPLQTKVAGPSENAEEATDAWSLTQMKPGFCYQMAKHLTN